MYLVFGWREMDLELLCVLGRFQFNDCEESLGLDGIWMWCVDKSGVGEKCDEPLEYTGIYLDVTFSGVEERDFGGPSGFIVIGVPISPSCQHHRNMHPNSILPTLKFNSHLWHNSAFQEAPHQSLDGEANQFQQPCY
mmetsp:Transcript_930/g.3206  ORF Transcript_930/g.3206 Transcript_930/m.3206 type:complete len:137 (-) Transcript_930:989-1399(-)